jgi:hypothetical protein
VAGRRALPEHDHAAEALQVAAGLVAPALLDELEELGPFAELGLVLQERLDLQLDDVCDVNVEVGLVVAPDVDLLDVVRLQALSRCSGNSAVAAAG